MSTISCPACSKPFELEVDTIGTCPSCAKTLDVRLFSPIALKIDEAAPAMPESAVCANHPAKRAEHICAGTGAFICALCAVNTGGEIFSASYLGTQAGKKKTQQVFAAELPRPDSKAGAILIWMFIPYINCLFYLASPFLIPWGFVLLAQAIRLRKSGDPVYARVIRPLGLWCKGIALGLIGLGIVGATLALIFAILQRKH